MTAQVYEKLMLDGQQTSMACCPSLPKGHPRIREINPAEMAEGDSRAFTTACWRGYIGSWEIKDGRLYLIGVIGRFRLKGKEPLFADWYSGVLAVPRGAQLKYVHMGFESVYEEELRIQITNGVVASNRVINNRPPPRWWQRFRLGTAK
jgi:hypothetical protein